MRFGRGFHDLHRDGSLAALVFCDSLGRYSYPVPRQVAVGPSKITILVTAEFPGLPMRVATFPIGIVFPRESL